MSVLSEDSHLEISLFTLSASDQPPIRTQTPKERRFQTADLFKFKRTRGDLTFSLVMLCLVLFLVWRFPAETGWDIRKLPNDMGHYLLHQLGIIEAEGRVTRFGKILKQGWVAPLFCLVILVPAVLLNLRLSVISLQRKMRQQMPLRWRYEMAQWARALEFIGYFILYTLSVPLLGYLLSTLLMGTYLTYRLGYRTWRWTGIALLSSFAIVLLFRTGLQIKTPVNIWLYNQLPEHLAIFLKTWF
ncbi:MAG: tripartite tricarboxylate transporter TctB family protein [Candidatus Puniceispirillaceae bacterium]